MSLSFQLASQPPTPRRVCENSSSARGKSSGALWCDHRPGRCASRSNSPRRRRVFSLAVTATDTRDRGQPTSWSAALDALAAGRTFDSATQGLVYMDENEDDAHRLFVVSAGNVHHLDVAHLDRSDLEPVHDPAHAWNALTVGAFTEKAVINPSRNGWSALARPGELSPWSTTSVLFEESWPIKPDVVFEGGNVGRNRGSLDFSIPDLCLLSTFYKPAEQLLTLSWATSAATSQVARMAAIIRADYPNFWPETVRALLVHSARWTPAMWTHFDAAGGRRARAKLARRYGHGVPNIERALRSANDALTLVVQSSIRPFAEGRMNEMHTHELPWPKYVLSELGQTTVQLRVTLSYFIEPNPGRRGWKTRHRYASHGLRFDVKSATENIDEFRKRINQRALDEDENRPNTGDSDGWFLGELARNKGSIHSDVWTGTAADLADRGVIGVFPVSGWWKDQKLRDRSNRGARYALIVSIETEAEGIDIWTPVASEIGVPIEIS
ncbi:MAG: S8 family peptidase [Deltaproteobacteria bacterium]|nr:S8 family peptidase [Deltaproteobacteria bacterium]